MLDSDISMKAKKKRIPTIIESVEPLTPEENEQLKKEQKVSKRYDVGKKALKAFSYVGGITIVNQFVPQPLFSWPTGFAIAFSFNQYVAEAGFSLVHKSFSPNELTLFRDKVRDFTEH